MKDFTSSISKLAHRFHPKIGQLYDWEPTYWNFALVGGGGVLINWSLFLLLRGFFGDLAWWVGTLAAWNFNYLLNKVWVFKNERGKMEKRKA